MYPVVFFDALRVKIRDDAVVRNKAVYLALAVLPDGTRDVLGIWIEQTEGAKFWLKVFNELRSRGVNDILIAVVDGLKGLADAITTTFPQTTVQTCIVHLIRSSLDYASWKERKAIAAALLPDLRRREAGGRAGRAGGLCEQCVGPEVSDHRAIVASRLGARDPVLRLPTRGAANHLHHEHDREPAHAAAQDHQEPRSLPERRGCDQTALAGSSQYQRRQGTISA
jgi:putative transposase